MDVLLVRHGLTDANAAGVIQGHQPTPLNAQGRAQAAAVAARLARGAPRPDVLVSSDLVRARQTAEPIAASCRLAIVSDDAWRERSFGTAEGTRMSNDDRWRVAAGELSPPGAEPAEEFTARVRGALDALPSRFPGARCVVVVTHGGPCRAILKTLGVDEARFPNCAITHLRHHEGAWHVVAVNDAAHLAEITVKDAG